MRHHRESQRLTLAKRSAIARRLTILAVLGGCTLALPSPPTKVSPALEELSGRYLRTFANSTADGEGYESTDVLEIVPTDPTRAKLYVSLYFRNGHSCELIGDAALETRDLVYAEPASPASSGCRVRFWRQGEEIRWSGNGQCAQHCGMRGTLDSGFMPYSARQRLSRAEAASIIREGHRD